MIRFIAFLLGKEYEPCKSCETLKQQLEFSNAEKKELLDTIMSLVKPQVQAQANIAELQPVAPLAATFSRRRAALEERDRVAAQILVRSKNIGHSDDAKVDALERELGLSDTPQAKEN